MWFKQAILYKKAALTQLLEAPLAAIAHHCADVWPDADALDAVLGCHIHDLPNCHLLYALDTDGRQISSNVAPGGVELRWRGQALAERPYQTGNLPYKGLVLSSVYVSTISHQPCITALQAVSEDGRLFGFIAADFNLDDVPLPEIIPPTEQAWTQYKGDPVIRQQVFSQQRQRSTLDQQVEAVITTIDCLMREHGVYHFILHFSSSRAIFWVFSDPYSYRFHSVEEILDPEIWLAYPRYPYPERAVVAPEQIRTVLEQFRSLREGDENIYLRSGSLNIMNGIIGLTFSCDGSHYLSVNEFLNRRHPFWV